MLPVAGAGVCAYEQPHPRCGCPAGCLQETFVCKMFSNVSYTEESEDALPNQHLKPRNECLENAKLQTKKKKHPSIFQLWHALWAITLCSRPVMNAACPGTCSPRTGGAIGLTSNFWVWIPKSKSRIRTKRVESHKKTQPGKLCDHLVQREHLFWFRWLFLPSSLSPSVSRAFCFSRWRQERPTCYHGVSKEMAGRNSDLAPIILCEKDFCDWSWPFVKTLHKVPSTCKRLKKLVPCRAWICPRKPIEASFWLKVAFWVSWGVEVFSDLLVKKSKEFAFTFSMKQHNYWMTMQGQSVKKSRLQHAHLPHVTCCNTLKTSGTFLHQGHSSTHKAAEDISLFRLINDVFCTWLFCTALLTSIERQTWLYM